MTKQTKINGILCGIGTFLALSFFWSMVLQFTLLDVGWKGFKGEIVIEFLVVIILSALCSCFLGYGMSRNQKKLIIPAVILIVILPVGFIATFLIVGLFNP
jgi:hypothetical protein